MRRVSCPRGPSSSQAEPCEDRRERVEDEVGEGVPPGQLLQVGEREVEDDARDDDRDHAVEPHRAEQRRRTVEPCRQETGGRRDRHVRQHREVAEEVPDPVRGRLERPVSGRRGDREPALQGQPERDERCARTSQQDSTGMWFATEARRPVPRRGGQIVAGSRLARWTGKDLGACDRKHFL